MRLKAWLLALKPVLGKVTLDFFSFLSILSFLGEGEGEEDEVETLCKLAQVHLLCMQNILSTHQYLYSKISKLVV